MATQEEVRKLLSLIVEHSDVFEHLPSKEVRYLIQHPNRMMAIIHNNLQGTARSTGEGVFSRPVSITELPLHTGTFSFVANLNLSFKSEPDASVEWPKISKMNTCFWEWFGHKAEESSGARSLCYATLDRFSHDSDVFDAVGGRSKAETTLCDMYSIMLKQKGSQTGPLIAELLAAVNVFYVRDASDMLRTVVLQWNASGWVILAFEINTKAHAGGCRVFYSQKAVSGAPLVEAAVSV